MNLDVSGDHINSKLAQEAITTHELMHLFGYRHPAGSGNVNYGRYDLQSGSQGGFYQVVDMGLVPIHPFTLAHPVNEPGWAPLPIPIPRDTLDLHVPDFFGHQLRSDRKSYIVEITHTGIIQSFLLVNHQGATPYDNKYQGSGLLIWHLLDPFDPEHGFRDLELASGKSPNAVDGDDALELSTPQVPYWGSAQDFFDGTSASDFSYLTNPNTNLYNTNDPPIFYPDPQDVLSGFAVENIRRSNTNGDMIADVYVDKAQILESPDGGGSNPIQRGSTIVVHWRVRPLLGAATVDLDIAETANGEFRSLGSGLPNTGTFNWLVLQKGGSDYRLKLTTRASGGSPHVLGTDISDNPITIDDDRSCP